MSDPGQTDPVAAAKAEDAATDLERAVEQAAQVAQEEQEEQEGQETMGEPSDEEMTQQALPGAEAIPSREAGAESGEETVREAFARTIRELAAQQDAANPAIVPLPPTVPAGGAPALDDSDRLPPTEKIRRGLLRAERGR